MVAMLARHMLAPTPRRATLLAIMGANAGDGVTRISAEKRLLLEALSQRFPTIDAALAELSSLEASLTLRKGTVHVISDVHGDFKKLRHIINNASGRLRPKVEALFGDRLSERERIDLLSALYYPDEFYELRRASLTTPEQRRAFLRTTLGQIFELLRLFVPRHSLESLSRALPSPFERPLLELLFAPSLQRSDAFLDALIDPFLRTGRDTELLRLAATSVHNATVAELVVAGDLGDRGPRIDKVIEELMRQRRISITWGNHDVSWMGASLGQTACIATVLRLSLRYGRLSQLEEGYGIPLAPLERLAKSLYAGDPAARFAVKGGEPRDPALAAKMQKAISVIQFKLEGQTSQRNLHFALAHRDLLHRLDLQAATVEIDGVTYPLLDAHLPTLDPKAPYELSAEEQACIDELRASFLESATLQEQMAFVARHGSLFVRRDDNVIFHGCLPVDAAGEPRALEVDGTARSGRALFEALERVVQRAFRDRQQRDLDVLWYLWTGPLSPCFGKDKMATFETYFVADEATHKETKNPYFALLHERDFCRLVLREMGADPDRGLIVNGHVPVKLERGERPVKRSGLAVTIDGAFSEVYGDKGYTLVLGASSTYLAQHHHFESVTEAILTGADIIPTLEHLRDFDPPHRVGDTEEGEAIRQKIAALEALIEAYRDNTLRERLRDVR